MTASDRRRLLIGQLVRGGVSRKDAERWRVMDMPRTPGRYLYVHPVVTGKGPCIETLSAAASAHLALSRAPVGARARARARPGADRAKEDARTGARAHAVHAAGSASALALLRAAEWEGVEGPAVAPALHGRLDVVELRDAAAFGADPDPADWTLRGLVRRRGYHLAERSCAVVAAGARPVMLALCVMGPAAPPELAAAAAHLPELHAGLAPRMKPQSARPGIVMFGVRWNKHAPIGSVRTGYYVAASPEDALRMRRDAALRDLVVGAATAMCAAERAASPAMAAHRAEHARRSGHPGVWPGAPVRGCPAAALGVSRAYVSPAHNDAGYRSMAETVVWNTRGVPRAADYCFAIVGAGVVVRLGEPDVMVMVPGTVRHGTPRPAAGHAEHPGVGAVIINKANLVTDEALADTRQLRARLDGTATNPFMGGFGADEACIACRICAKQDARLMLLCDECNEGYHAACLRLGLARPEDAPARWFCPRCSLAMQMA